VDNLHTPEKIVGEQQLKEVVELLQDIPEGHGFLAEQAFILAKPSTIDLLCQGIFHELENVVENMEEISNVRVTLPSFVPTLTDRSTVRTTPSHFGHDSLRGFGSVYLPNDSKWTV